MSPLLDLLIIGAGPTGLGMAAAALHRGARRVLVVEQARAFRPVGSNVDILPNAYRTMCALAPGIREGLQPFLRTPKAGKPRLKSMTVEGEELEQIETQQYGPTAHLKWWQLQRVLYEVLPDREIVVLNHQLVDLRDEGEVVVAEFVMDRQRENQFKNWEGDDNEFEESEKGGGDKGVLPAFEAVQGWSSSFGTEYGPEVKRVRVRARLVVGADGINSAARRCVYRDTAPGWERYAGALYSGYVKVVAMGSPEGEHEDEAAVSDLYVKNSDISMITCRREDVAHDSLRVMLVKLENRLRAPFRWYVGYSLAIDEGLYENSSKEEIVAIVAQRAQKYRYSENLINLSRFIWGCGKPGAFSTRSYHVIPAKHPPPYEPIATSGTMEYPDGFTRPWYHGRVVLAGDSVHASPPFQAQGTAMGAEDVLDLVTRLTALGVWEGGEIAMRREGLGRVFREYREARLDRVCCVQALVMNRLSEFDVETTSALRNKLLSFGSDLPFAE